MKTFIISLPKKVVPGRYHPYLLKLYENILDSYGKLAYRGNRLECPFCGGHFGKFLPTGVAAPVGQEKNMVGGGYRMNARCPSRSCDSSDRERLVFLYLKEETNIFSARVKLLHVAPEPNLQKVFMRQRNIEYLSADFDSPLAMIQMDITDIQYNDNTFDVVVCNHVLEHIPDDKKAMAELYRVLKPDGWAILQVPLSLSLQSTFEDPNIVLPEHREKLFGQFDHVRIYGKDYKERLEAVGFLVNEYETAKEFGADTVRRFALLEKENLYICSKK